MSRGSLQAQAIGANLRSPDGHAFAVTVLARTFRMHRGNAVRAAEVLHVAHRTLMGWVATYPDVASALRNARRRLL